MVDLGQKKVDFSAFFYAQNSKGGEHHVTSLLLATNSANLFLITAKPFRYSDLSSAYWLLSKVIFGPKAPIASSFRGIFAIFFPSPDWVRNDM